MDEEQGITERFMAFHAKVKNAKFYKVQNVFSDSEFFAVSRIIVITVGRGCHGDPVGKGVSMKYISAGMNVSPAMATKTITSLEKRGIVTRCADEGDRRGVKVSLTEEGFEKWKEAKRSYKAFVDKVFQRFGEEKTRQYLDLAEELVDIAREERDKFDCNDPTNGKV